MIVEIETHVRGIRWHEHQGCGEQQLLTRTSAKQRLYTAEKAQIYLLQVYHLVKGSPEAEKYCFNCHCLSRDLNHSNHLSRCVHFGTHCGAFTKIMSRSCSPHPFHSVGDLPFMGLNLSDLRMYRLQSMTAKCVFM